MQERYEERLKVARLNSNSLPISREAADQLLILAQLELQNVSWDLASETAFFENADLEKEDSAAAKKRAIELQATRLEAKLQSIELIEKKE